MLRALLTFLFFSSSAKHRSQKIHFAHPSTQTSIFTQHSHTAQANHPSSAILSQHTSITMSASNSAAKPQETLEYKCYIEARDVDKDCERPFVEVLTTNGDFFPTTDDKGHERLGGPRMYIHVERDSPFAVIHKVVTVVCSRDKGSGKNYSVSIKPTN